MNIADSCFKSDKSGTAIIYQEEGKQIKSITYSELDILSNRVANGLVKLGLTKGDPIAIDMIMTVEAVAIYLGIIKAGCVVVSIADSLAAAEVAKRLELSNAKAIFTQDIMMRFGKEIPLYSKIINANPKKVIVLPGLGEIKVKLRKQDITWRSFLSDDPYFISVSCDPDDPCNILFSSGTTGVPKVIPWSHTTPVKCAADGYLHQDIQPGEVVSWPTNIGWMMGPWLIFASLINEATIGLYYGPPTNRRFGEFVEKAKVNMLGVVPSMVKQWKARECMKGLDWSEIKCYSSTGEASNIVDYHWLMARAGYKPVIEYCGGTEIGGGYACGTMVQPASPSTFSTPSLGLDLLVLNEERKPDKSGELFIIPPSIGLSIRLLNKDHHSEYYAGSPECPAGATGIYGEPVKNQIREFGMQPVLRSHGDEIEVLPNGYLRALGRADDTMNLGGIKVSSKEIERLLDELEGVKETAAIAINPHGGGPSKLVLYAVLQDTFNINPSQLKIVFQQTIKKKLNPLFKVTDVVLLDDLPRTASNKVMRRMLRDRYEKQL